jgi:hypothetical protein
MLPVATKVSAGCAVGDALELGVSIGPGVGLAIADAVALGTAEVAALGLLGALEQPASPMTATTPASAKRNGGSGVRWSFVPGVVVAIRELPVFVMPISPLLTLRCVRAAFHSWDQAADAWLSAAKVTASNPDPDPLL